MCSIGRDRAKVIVMAQTEVKRRKYVMKSYFSGMPKREDLEIVEEVLPPLKDGEFLCEAEWLSVDPYMRPYSQSFPLGTTMIGAQVARVIESKSDKYSVGDYLVGNLGWVSHAVINPEDKTPGLDITKVDASVPANMRSAALGVLGMTGATAYFGFLELCQPKAGETLVVTGAAGAVGSIVGQIAKIKGCRVVGFAGSDAKVEYLKSIGFDLAYNYKTIDSLDKTLKEACPDGIDMFFDNVGGDFFANVLANMNLFGRVSICGAISEYNAKERGKSSGLSSLIIGKQLRLEGFIVTRWLDQWPKAFKEIMEWIKEDKLKYNEKVTDGFDKMFDAFVGLFTGNNTGKAVVKA